MNPNSTLAALLLLIPLSACAADEARAVESTAPEPAARPVADVQAADAHFEAGRWAEAIPIYEETLGADPDQGRAWFRLGYALHITGELERACAAHRKAAAYPEFAPIATYNLACAHALLGRPDQAFAELDRAVALGFTNAKQLDGDADLASLHADPRWAALRGRVAGGPSAPELRHFDFWVGEWDVATASGQKLGTNRISSQLDGHLILEEWASAGGGTGKSMNYWDRDARQWKQVWIDEDGTVLQMAGAFTDGAMRFRGATMYKGGPTVEHKTTLTPLEDGRVRQFIEESRDGGTTWKGTFDGYYARRAGG